VSLGLFRNKNNVAGLQQQFTAKGFDTEIIAERKNTILYWLDVSLTGGLEIQDRFQDFVATLAPPVSFESFSCAPQAALGESQAGNLSRYGAFQLPLGYHSGL
jgi:hypothetical protein